MKTTIIENAIDLQKLVIAEAKKLKANATKSELDNLDFEDLDSTHTERCVYGQMTNDCNSKRAKELIGLSCKRVFNVGDRIRSSTVLNGSPIGKDRDIYWSPIEVFIDKCENKGINNQKLIAFLKDETKTLVF